MPRSLQVTDYLRTRVLGFSVTHEMWIASGGFYENYVAPSQIELLWYSGASIDLIADPNSPLWTANGNSLNTTTQGGLINGVGGDTDPTVHTSAIDRVIINISGLASGPADPTVPGYNGGTRPDLGITGSTTGFPVGGYSTDVPTWRAYIAAAVANVRSKYPNVKMILLQPNLGGPGGGQQCLAASTQDGDPSGFSSPSGIVRCCFTNPYILAAVDSLVRANVRMGFINYISACNRIRDWAGHLLTAEYEDRGLSMALYYNSNL